MKTFTLKFLPIAGFILFISACKTENENNFNAHADSSLIAQLQFENDSLLQALNLCNGTNVQALNMPPLATLGNSASEELNTKSKVIYTNRKDEAKIKTKFIKRVVPIAGKNYYAVGKGSFPEASSRLLTESDLTHLSSWGYSVMLNEIYARHGMSFTDDALQNHFNQQPWYKTGRKNVDKYLTRIEKQNIEFLKNNPK